MDQFDALQGIEGASAVSLSVQFARLGIEASWSDDAVCERHAKGIEWEM